MENKYTTKGPRQKHMKSLAHLISNIKPRELTTKVALYMANEASKNLNVKDLKLLELD